MANGQGGGAECASQDRVFRVHDTIKVVGMYWVALASGYECMDLDDVRALSRRLGAPIKVFDASGFLRGTVYPDGSVPGGAA